MEENMKSYAFIGFLIGLLSFILILQRILLKRLKSKPSHLPPSPMALPIIGHLHLLSLIPHQGLHKLSKLYGPLMSIRLGYISSVVASDADTAREFLKSQEIFFSDRPASKVSEFISYGTVNMAFSAYGPYWRFLKKLCMTKVLGNTAIERLLPFRREELLLVLQNLRQKSDAGETVDMANVLKMLTNNVVCRMTMSTRCSGTEGEAEEAKEVVEEMLQLVGSINLADFIWVLRNFDLQGLNKRLKDVHGRYDRMMERILKEKEEVRNKKMEEGMGGGDEDRLKDLLDILLDISEDETAEIKLSRENIKAFILDIFVAGTDTSALTTEWALAELINHPSVMKKASEEIDAVVGKTRLVEESDVPNLPYLQAIVKETLRLHPAAPMTPRTSSKDCQIKGYDIPAKTRLLVNIWAIGRDPNHWTNPLEFKPERFMEEEGKGISVKGQCFQLLPFGSGRRSCPGAYLALQLVHSTLSALVQCFDWEVEGGVVDMTERPGFTLSRAQSLVCKSTARLNPLPLP